MSPFEVAIGANAKHKTTGLVAVVESHNTYRTKAHTRDYYGVVFPDGRTALWEVVEAEAV